MNPDPTKYYVYILYSALADRYYIGHSHNPWLRHEFHNSQDKNAFTTKGRPWELKAVFETGIDRSAAMAAEKFIKKQKSRRLIEYLIDPTFEPDGSLAQLVRVPYVRD